MFGLTFEINYDFLPWSPIKRFQKNKVNDLYYIRVQFLLHFIFEIIFKMKSNETSFLRFISILLFIRGHTLCREKWIVTLIRLVILLLGIFSSLFFFFFTVEWNTQPSNLMKNLLYLLWIFIIFIIHLHLFKTKKRTIVLTRNLMSVLSSLESRRLIRVALIASLSVLSYILFQFIIRVIVYRIRSILPIVSLFFDVFQNITILMIIIYVLFFYLLSFNLSNLLNLVIKYLTKHRNQAKLIYVHDILLEIEYNINGFDSLFSAIPFFSITINFLSATYQVLHLTTGNRLGSLVDFISDHIALILYLSFISNQ